MDESVKIRPSGIWRHDLGGVDLPDLRWSCSTACSTTGPSALGRSPAVSGLLTYMSVVLLGDFIDYRLSLAGVIGLERGWRRARRTILVADAMSFLCGLVLYVMSVGPVQGFAFTLGLITLIALLPVAALLLIGVLRTGPVRGLRPAESQAVRTFGLRPC
jgi:hypothetical protein